jgi:RNA polymerase sigma factor (sigma-70 family)
VATGILPFSFSLLVTKQEDPETLRIDRAKAGDKAAFHALYMGSRDAVARLVFRMGTPRADLEDVVQDVFIQVFRSLKDFRGQSKFSTWVHKVTVNVVLMYRRAKKVRPVFSDEVSLDLQAPNDNPEREAEQRLRMQAFAHLLEKLTEKKRDVFVLHDLEGMAPDEIADAVGAPVLTVRTRLFYARRELEELMKNDPLFAEAAANITAEVHVNDA